MSVSQRIIPSQWRIQAAVVQQQAHHHDPFQQHIHPACTRYPRADNDHAPAQEPISTSRIIISISKSSTTRIERRKTQKHIELLQTCHPTRRTASISSSPFLSADRLHQLSSR